MTSHTPDPIATLPEELAAEEWRGIARGLHAHMTRTGRRHKDLAEAAGMAVSNLSAYLNLHRSPSQRTMRRVLVAAVRTQGVTEAMIDHWMRQPDTREARLLERIAELEEAGVELTRPQRDRLLSAAASDDALSGAMLRLSDEIQSLRTRCQQLTMAHADAAGESLVQSAVEAFHSDPRMRRFMREVEADIRRAHASERRDHGTITAMLEAMLQKERIKVERTPPTSPRAVRGRWEGMRWLLSLKDEKRAEITTAIHPAQYPFELGRVVGHLRMMRLLGPADLKEIGVFARDWVAQNFPQAPPGPAAAEQLEQDVIWLIVRSLAGRWATGLFTLPADRFVRLAESRSYDVDGLAAALNVSWETVVNRISQLDSGLPVHFVKMDWRGVVLKRSSYSGLQFAPLYMRICGRWASARSLLTVPGNIVRQYSVFPDLAGQTYFCVGRSVRAPLLHFGAAPLVYSLTLGVQAKDAGRMIYAQKFHDGPVECGVTCRLCTVLNCENRVSPSASLPGMGRFDSQVIWSGKTIHERVPADR
jgi:transcriptional regulator with XRE-family HTH domain